MKILVLILAALFFILAFVLPSYKVWVKTGVNPVRFTKEDNAHNYIGKIFKLVIIALFIDVIIYALINSWYNYLIPISLLNKVIMLKYIGIVLIFLSLFIVLLAQAKMANSWRIGIDNDNKTKLVTNGIFKISRNPIFLALHICLLGLFLSIPNVLSLMVLVVGVLCIQIQVRLEEDFLLQMHPDEYPKYKAKVRRWI